MSSLLELLRLNPSQLKTQKGLIILGLQNDFLSPGGLVPIQSTGFVEELHDLVRTFRDLGRVIWVRSEYEGAGNVDEEEEPESETSAGASDTLENEPNPSTFEKLSFSDDQNSPVNKISKTIAGLVGKRTSITMDAAESPTSSAKLSEEDSPVPSFLNPVPPREIGCARGTKGAEYAPTIKALIENSRDLQIVKSQSSAFTSTSLLPMLRSNLITELFVCGCLTEISVYATAMDAARYGITINLVEDCLGYRAQYRHNLAITRLCEVMEAGRMTSREVINLLRNPYKRKHSKDDSGEDDDDENNNDESAEE